MQVKAVIDTNVAVSGLLWKGTPNEILRLARQGDIEICSSSPLLDELQRVLEYKRFRKRINALGITKEGLFDYYQGIVTVYQEKSSVDVIRADITDNRFIEAAIDSKAAVIVSGDEHLLALKEFEKIQILNPAEFITLFGKLKKRRKL